MSAINLGMANDPPTVKKTVIMPPALWERVEDYRFGKRLKTETDAINRLLEAGLKVIEAEAVP